VRKPCSASSNGAGCPRRTRSTGWRPTLTSEEVYLKEDRDITDAAQHLERFIEDVYNTKRLHSALGYCPPAEFELLLAKQACELALVR
jgi:putative transposase